MDRYHGLDMNQRAYAFAGWAAHREFAAAYPQQTEGEPSAEEVEAAAKASVEGGPNETRGDWEGMSPKERQPWLEGTRAGLIAARLVGRRGASQPVGGEREFRVRRHPGSELFDFALIGTGFPGEVGLSEEEEWDGFEVVPTSRLTAAEQRAERLDRIWKDEGRAREQAEADRDRLQRENETLRGTLKSTASKIKREFGERELPEVARQVLRDDA